MQRIIIGTAGHVDHGKSALVKALTGIDPDRLPEEKVRKMTIDLGFVFFPISNDEEVAIIDVPGHEHFLKTMIAGANSIRMVLFVVAADEGVMPQTLEHLDVLKLLGVQKGIIVITKIDKTEPDFLSMVVEDIKNLVKGGFLENALILKVSSLTNEGIEGLKETIKAICKEIKPLSDTGIFRCPIDRIFSMKGFGTIVAGTVISGRLNKLETIEVLPTQKRTRIRNLQVHNQPAIEVFAGQRAAFNLMDITVPEIYRGCEMSIPGYLKPTKVIDAELSLLPNVRKPLMNRERVRLHKGTSEVMARVIILDKEKIEPGEKGFVQLRLENPIVGERKEYFILRTYSPMRVIGGGRFLEVYPPIIKRYRLKKEKTEYLQKLKDANEEEIVLLTILHTQPPITNERELMQLTNIPINRLTDYVLRLLKEGKISRLKDNSLIHNDYLKDLKDKFLKSAEEFIKANPLKVLINRSELVKISEISHPLLLEKVLKELTLEAKIEMSTNGVQIVGLKAKISPEAQRITSAIENFALKMGFKPLKLNDIFNTLTGETKERIKVLLNYLLKNEKIIELTDGIYIHKERLTQIKAKLIQYLNEKGTIRAVECKNLLGVSRDDARDILDYLFKQGITVRTEGTHRLVN